MSGRQVVLRPLLRARATSADSRQRQERLRVRRVLQTRQLGIVALEGRESERERVVAFEAGWG